MRLQLEITATIVLYNESLTTLQKTVDDFLQVPLKKRLFLIDNSPTDILKNTFKHPEITYIFVGKNIGFGAAHNRVISTIKTSDYHLILNPDVSFLPQTIPNLIYQFAKKTNVAMIVPKVVSFNGKPQYTCRKNPSIKEMLSRRLGIFKKYVHKRAYRDLDLSKSFYPEFVSGCFMLFKTEEFIKIGGFDQRYFLYMEDADICRKIAMTGKQILYYPKETIEHLNKKESSKKLKLLYYHIVSAVKYFNKWGVHFHTQNT